MKIFPTVLSAIGATLFVSLVVPTPARAAIRIDKSMYPESKVKADCEGFGTFYPSNAENNGMYGCIYNGTGGVTCGGVGGNNPGTCTISFRPPPRKLPTQGEWQASEHLVNKTEK